ncbi:MAG: hypothetical protein CVU84_15445 [Firmicutes bacterium HGW-Firmicutes-1]|jgi:ABC-type transport system involved in multi-copper enzyme maturation permease subunit|nr:MAG: hypothetical protein CVU84_15445 [Firmicutes bacterium HGW-Firmicutes-1]
MINPILERELKTRMRTWKTPIMLMIYLIIIGIVVALFFVINEQRNRYGYGGGGTFDPTIAIRIYNLIVIGQFIILMLVLPAFTATAISGERERQTLDLMLCTDLSPWKIISGKITAALSFVFLLIIASSPFMSIVFLFGGITMWEIVKVILFYMITSVLVSCIGLYCSTRFKRVVTSIIITYLIMGVLFVGTLIAYGVFMMVMSSRQNVDFITKYSYEILLAFLGPNPGFGLASFYLGDYLSVSYWLNISTGTFKAVQPWMISVAFDVVVSAILVVLTKLRLTKIR